MKILALIAVVLICAGCAKTNGAADLKQPDTAWGNFRKVTTIASPLTFIGQVTFLEIWKDLQDNCWNKSKKVEIIEAVPAEPCTSSCDL